MAEEGPKAEPEHIPLLGDRAALDGVLAVGGSGGVGCHGCFGRGCFVVVVVAAAVGKIRRFHGRSPLS
eukprot:scaffold4863_cov53-Cyclotella_meneghiniana.AAC.2